MFEIIFPFLGFFVSFFIGLTGVGGAALMTPLLFFLGIPAATAVGSDIVYNAISRVYGSVLHIRANNVSVRATAHLLIGSLPATLAGLAAMMFIKGTYGVEQLNLVVSLALAVVLMMASPLMLLKVRSKYKYAHSSNPDQEESAFTASEKLGFVSAGAATGLSVQITSVGAGAVLMPFLFRLLKSPRRMVGTDVFHGLILTIVAGLFHYGFLGTVQLTLVALLLLGSIPGMFVGVKLTTKVPSRALAYIIVLLVFVAGLMVVVKVLSTFSF